MCHVGVSSVLRDRNTRNRKIIVSDDGPYLTRFDPTRLCISCVLQSDTKDRRSLVRTLEVDDGNRNGNGMKRGPSDLLLGEAVGNASIDQGRRERKTGYAQPGRYLGTHIPGIMKKHLLRQIWEAFFCNGRWKSKQAFGKFL